MNGALTTSVVCVLALGLSVGLPHVMPGDQGAAYANNGKGKGNGGGNKGGNKGSRASKSKSEKHASRATSNDGSALHPRDLGRWNAANANQAALDAHIRNQNFNGTVGALAQYQLVSRAAAGEELSPEEQRALDGLIAESGGGTPVAPDDADVADYLNSTGETGVLFDVNDGVVSCVAGCEDLTAEEFSTVEALAQLEADAFVDENSQTNAEADLAALQSTSEQRIIEGAPPRHTAEKDEPLLDRVSDDLGVAREQFNEDLQEAGTQLQSDMKKAGAAIKGLFKKN